MVSLGEESLGKELLKSFVVCFVFVPAEEKITYIVTICERIGYSSRELKYSYINPHIS